MFVITIIVGLALAYGAFRLLCLIQTWVAERHGYLPFTKPLFFAVTAGFVALLMGMQWYASAIQAKGDTLNGLALALVGTALLVGVVVRHIRRTTLATGIGISMVQLPLFAALAYVGIFVLLLFFALAVVFPAVMKAINPPMVRVAGW